MVNRGTSQTKTLSTQTIAYLFTIDKQTRARAYWQLMNTKPYALTHRA
jgi:hypothetical protein